MKVTKQVVGGPGAGKTTALLRIVEEELETGVNPRELAFVSFTRKAANEARERAGEKFGLGERDLPWFRTLHSVAYRQLNVRRNEMLQRRHYQEIGAALGLTLDVRSSAADEPAQSGSRALFTYDYARNTLQSLRDAYLELGEDDDWREVELVANTLTEYKQRNAMYDYTDLLSQCEREVNIEVLVIDEAQDLTKLQWEFIRRIFPDAERIYVGGDDDQAIYRWSGADVDAFIDLEATAAKVLPISHRLPQRVFDVGSSIIRQVRQRIPKDWTAAPRKGHVFSHVDEDELDLSEGTWYLLARNGYLLKRWSRLLEEQGLPYTTVFGPAINQDDVTAMRAWEHLRKGERVTGYAARQLLQRVRGRHSVLAELDDDYEYSHRDLLTRRPDVTWYEGLTGMQVHVLNYYRNVLSAGNRLSEPPRIHVATMHGVKGGEADHVGILTDVSRRCHDAQDLDCDSEHRVFYVGVTRARESLHVVQPTTEHCYEFWTR